jgi:hypothetical protein
MRVLERVMGPVAAFSLVSRWALGVLVLLCAAVFAGSLGRGVSDPWRFPAIEWKAGGGGTAG